MSIKFQVIEKAEEAFSLSYTGKMIVIISLYGSRKNFSWKKMRSLQKSNKAICDTMNYGKSTIKDGVERRPKRVL